jgi:alkanesulfonate monooxygenase SsuD/methylene tetrahydromethanopterin reductase-like flavin-dependent oxidoreductase (luciferase family)
MSRPAPCDTVAQCFANVGAADSQAATHSETERQAPMTSPETTQATRQAPDADSRVGVGVTPFHSDADATIRLAVRAEELGYARFGTAEGWTQDAVVLLAQIAGVTSRIGLATTVLPVWSRTPAAIAMAAASLQRASGGRFALGLGASSPPLVEGLHGLTWQQPVERMRTTLVAVRALLEGRRLPLERDNVRPLRLGAPPERRVPILVAALAPSSVRLTGELADDWLPFLWARSRLSDGRALLAEGEARAEAPSATRVAASVPLAIAEEEETSRQIAAEWLLTYLTRMGPLYPRMLRERFGFADEVEALLAANAGGGAPRLPAAAERLAREVIVMGTYDEAPRVVRRWLEAGADTINLVLPLSAPEPQLREMLEATAPAATSSAGERAER